MNDSDWMLSLAVARSPLVVSPSALRLGQWQVGLLKKLHKRSENISEALN
ncbi:hypothetical protein NDI39_15155 [Microcoleus sp. ZQ-A2]|nr:hypothetical protein [Microcoleus sp. FACHB-1]